MPREKRLFPYHDEPLFECRFGCHRQIYFIPTAKGHVMPVDFETKEVHFAHCPNYPRFKALKERRRPLQ